MLVHRLPYCERLWRASTARLPRGVHAEQCAAAGRRHTLRSHAFDADTTFCVKQWTKLSAGLACKLPSSSALLLGGVLHALKQVLHGLAFLLAQAACSFVNEWRT